MRSLADSWKQCVRSPDDESVWEQLLDCHKQLFSRIVVRVAHRFGVNTNGDLDDGVQEVCMKLSTQARSGKIPDVDDSSLEAYLKASIANAAHDYFRAQHAKRRNVTLTTSIDGSGAPQQPGGPDLDHAVLLGQIEHMVEGSQRDRNVFLLYYRHGWTAKEISALPVVNLSQKGVESLVFRITAALRKRVEESPHQEGFDKGFSQPSA